MQLSSDSCLGKTKLLSYVDSTIQMCSYLFSQFHFLGRLELV